MGKEVPPEGLRMTLELLQREWAAAEAGRAEALRRLQREHEVHVYVFCAREREFLVAR